jgi:hypothetical protein
MCSAPPWCAPCCCHHQGASRTPPAPTAEPGHHSFLLPLSQQTNSKHQTQPWDVRKNAAVAACGTQPSIAKAGSIPQASRVTQKASGARARTSDTGKDQPPTGTASRCCSTQLSMPLQANVNQPNTSLGTKAIQLRDVCQLYCSLTIHNPAPTFLHSLVHLLRHQLICCCCGAAAA